VFGRPGIFLLVKRKIFGYINLLFFMDRYQVPQFIEEDPKISSFFNMGQLIFIVIGGVIIFFLHFIVTNGFIFAILAILVGALSLSLAFLKVGGLPFSKVLPGIIKQFWHPKNYIYKSK